ncbi:hypothetical protein [Vibrio paucivorans]
MDQFIINKIGEAMTKIPHPQYGHTEDSSLMWRKEFIYELLSDNLNIPITASEWTMLVTNYDNREMAERGYSGAFSYGAELSYTALCQIFTDLKGQFVQSIVMQDRDEFYRRVNMLLDYFNPNIGEQWVIEHYSRWINRQNYKEEYKHQTRNLDLHNQQPMNQAHQINHSQFEHDSNRALFGSENAWDVLSVPDGQPIVDVAHNQIVNGKTMAMNANNHYMTRNNHQVSTEQLNATNERNHTIMREAIESMMGVPPEELPQQTNYVSFCQKYGFRHPRADFNEHLNAQPTHYPPLTRIA